MRAIKVAVILMVFGLVCITSNCYAGGGDTYTWLGGNGNDWSTDANWDDPPSASTSDTVKYQGDYAGSVTSNNDKFTTSDTFKDMNFVGDTGDSITVTGDGLSLTSGISVTGCSAVIDIDLNHTAKWNIATFADGAPGELTINGNIVTSANDIDIRPAGGANPIVINGIISGSGTLIKETDGPCTLTGANTYTGGTTVSTGTLTGTTTSLQGNITINDGTQLHVDQTTSGTYSGVMSGWGVVYKKGSGTATFTGTNTYIPPTYINGGTVILSGADGELATNAITVNEGSEIRLSNASANNNDRISDSTGVTLNDGTLSLLGSSSVNTTETIGTITVGNGASTVSLTSGSGHSTVLTAAGLTDGGGTVDFIGLGLGTAGNYPRIMFTSAPSLTNGVIPFATLNGSDIATYDPTNGMKAFTAYVTDISAATPTDNVKLSSTESLGGGTVNVYSLVLEDGVDLNESVSSTLVVDSGQIVLPGTSILDVAVLNVGAAGGSITADGDATINSEIVGAQGFTKTGTGTLTLTGDSSSLGTTTVALGELIVDGTIGDAIIHAGGILSGTGTTGEVNIYDYGVVSPGSSPGTIYVGDTIWGEDGSYLWEINDSDVSKGNDPGWDWMDITGTLTINATAGNPFTIDITSLGLDNNPGVVADFSSSQSYDWILATASSGITGFLVDKFELDATDFLNDLGGGSFSLAQDSNDIVLSFTGGGGGGPVPEPSTILLMACLGLGLLWYRRRKV
ncbi:autotransporter-associated beta strand repeat-containing protein [Candidatus Auribacterota bacterium]